jgi:ribulose-phosphate 3-epimerase
MAKEIKIAPSVLAADFANLERDIKMLNQSNCDYAHIDIMDGVFVPNISFGMPVLAAINTHSTKPLDVHLMIVEPDKYLAEFKNLGASILTVHVEACPHLHRTIQVIKSLGCKAGVALNPHTPISSIEHVLQDLDLVCIMSVNPGFGGQKFIENTYKKVKELRALAQECNPTLYIEIDGGVNLANAPKLIEAGADFLVAGSFVFNAKDPIETIASLKSLS